LYFINKATILRLSLIDNPNEIEIMSYREVTHKSWFSRIINSFVGVLFGFLFFLGSFFLLFWNEGRVNLAKVAKTAQEITAGGSAEAGQLIALTGALKSSSSLGDDYLKAGDYIYLNRRVEMYAWKEDKDSKTKKNIGGSETTTTDYNYRKEWTSNPENSSNFKVDGYHNPSMHITEKEQKANQIELEGFQLEQTEDLSLSAEPLHLSQSLLKGQNEVVWASDRYLFSGQGSLERPQIGDLRLSYEALPNPSPRMTLFAAYSATNRLAPFNNDRVMGFYRALKGDKTEAINYLQTEHNTTRWILRGLGFFLMWVGLSMIYAPISVFLDIVPIAGRVTRFMAGVASFLISAILSSITIIISLILHNWIALLITLLLVGGGIVYYLKSKKQTT